MMTNSVSRAPLLRLVGITISSVFVSALAACGETRSRAPEQTTSELPPREQAPVGQPAPAPDPILTRKDLVEAASQAASAYAQGDAIPAEDGLVGRDFAVRIAFGCEGPAAAGREEPGIGHWSWSPDRSSIRLGMTPADWRASSFLARVGAGETWEAVEGFWIPRPWLMRDGCPQVATDPLRPTIPAAPQTLGLAAVFDAGGSRVGRREGRAYRFTVRAGGDVPLAPPKTGYRLRLEGRTVAFPSGAAIACRANGPDDRPVCVVAARLDRVTMENADGTVLAEWRTEQP